MEVVGSAYINHAWLPGIQSQIVHKARLDVHNVKSGLSNKVIQALGGWESPDMVSHYAASLTFDEAFRLYKQVNGGQV